MNMLKKYKMVHETPSHFVLHDGEAHFHVAKKGLDPEMLGKIKAMPSAVQAPQNFDEGGEAESSIDELGGYLKKTFSTPEPKTPQPESLEEKNARIREEAHKDFMGQPHQYSEGGKVPKLGTGKRFEKLEKSIAKNSKVDNPGAVAAAIGREKYGNKKFNALAHHKHMHEGGKVDHNVNKNDVEEVAKFNTPAEYAAFIQVHKFDDGGNVEPIHKPTPEEMQEAMRNAFHYDDGGNVTPATKEPTDFQKSIANAFKYSGGKIQHYSVGTLDAGESMDAVDPKAVQREEEALAINKTAMPPQSVDNNNIIPQTAQPMNPEEFKSQAEYNVAKDAADQADKITADAAANQMAAQQAQIEQNNQIASQNEVRARAGLPPLAAVTMPDPTGTPAQSIPQNQQISFQPQGQQRQPSSFQGDQGSLVKDFNKSLGQVQGGMQKSAQLQSQGLQENANNIQSFLDDQRKRQADFQVQRQKLQQESDNLFNQVRDSKVDPNHFWQDKSTGAKISAALGLFFGGIGAGITGQPNIAAQFLQKSIDRDIDAQKADQSNKMNMYKLGLEKYKDAQSAEQFATLQAQTVLAGQIQQTAAKIGSPQAMALAQQAIGELHLKYDPIRNELALKQAALNYSQPTQSNQQSAGMTSGGINVNKMNTFMNAGLYDPETKKSLIKEQGEYIKAKNLNDLTDNLFKTQSQNANYTNRFPGAEHFPSFRESTKQYDASTKAYLDKMTKDLTGRVTPQSMENLEASLPKAGDSEQTLNVKRNAFKDLIKSGYEFPTLMDKGLLSPNDPVAQSTGNINAKFNQGKPVVQ